MVTARRELSECKGGIFDHVWGLGMEIIHVIFVEKMITCRLNTEAIRHIYERLNSCSYIPSIPLVQEAPRDRPSAHLSYLLLFPQFLRRWLPLVIQTSA